VTKYYVTLPPISWSDDEIRDYYDTTNITLSTLASMTGKSISKLKEILAS
jgi:hypothetical protein